MKKKSGPAKKPPVFPDSWGKLPNVFAPIDPEIVAVLREIRDRLPLPTETPKRPDESARWLDADDIVNRCIS